MKRFVAVCLFTLLSSLSFGQLLEPVKWEISSTQSGINEYILIFKASVEEGWKMYSHDLPAEGGPIPTSLVFENLPAGVQLVGEMEEMGRMEEHPEPLFDNMVIKFYKKRLTLRQAVKITGPATITGYIDYMTCDDMQCINPTKDFSITLQGQSGNLVTDPNANYGNVKNPVTVEYWQQKINEQEYWITFNTSITPTWKLYSQFSPEGGARPMELICENAGQGYQRIGKVEENGHVEVKPELLDLNGLNLFNGGLTGNGTVTSGVAGNVSLLVKNGFGVDTTFSGSIIDGSGTVNLTKTQNGNLTLTGHSTQTGGTTVQAGRVTNATGSSAVLGRLEAQTVTALGNGGVTLEGGTLRLNAATLLNGGQNLSEVINGIDFLRWGGSSGLDITVSATSVSNGFALPANTTSYINAAGQNAGLDNLMVNAPIVTFAKGTVQVNFHVQRRC